MKNKIPFSSKFNLTVFADGTMDNYYPSLSKEENNLSITDDAEKLESNEETPVKLLPHSKIKRVVLDEEFDDWLKRKKLRNTSKNRSIYADEISEEESLRLWKKHNMDYDILPFLISVIIEVTDGEHVIPSNDISISQFMVSKVQKYIADVSNLNIKNVWVHSTLSIANSFFDETVEDLYNFLEQWFKGEDVSFEMPKYIMKQSGGTVDIRFIPIGLKIPKKVLLTYKELNEEYDIKIFVNQHNLTKLKKYFDKEFAELFIEANITGGISGNFCDPYRAMDVADDFINLVNMEIEKRRYSN